MAAGALCAAGWGDSGVWLLATAAVSFLGYRLAHSPSVLLASRDGALFGFGQAGVVVVDALVALLVASEIPVPVACLSGLLYLALAAAFSGLASALIRMANANGGQFIRSALFFSAAMTLSEWARIELLPEQAVVSLGYVFLDTPLAGFAPIGGVHSVGFSGFALAYSLQGALTGANARKRQLLACVGWLCIGAACSAVPWVEAILPPVSFRLVESNLSLADESDSGRHLQFVEDLTRQLQKAPADIVATAETAFGMGFHQLPAAVLSSLHSFSRESSSHVLVGTTRVSSRGDWYNSVFHINPESDGRVDVIDKRLLMPVGEFVPGGLSWVIPKGLPFVKDLVSGSAAQAPFSLRGVKIGVVICREELTGEAARSWASKATLIVNPSNLAWFSGSLIISRELQVARMRALEIGRPFLRVTNMGGAAYIDASGRIRQEHPLGESGVLTGVATPMRGETPFVKFGNHLIVLLCVVLILQRVLHSRKRRSAPSVLDYIRRRRWLVSFLGAFDRHKARFGIAEHVADRQLRRGHRQHSGDGDQGDVIR